MAQIIEVAFTVDCKILGGVPLSMFDRGDCHRMVAQQLGVSNIGSL